MSWAGPAPERAPQLQAVPDLNILLVSRGAPRTPRSGAQVRAYQLARALKAIGSLDLAVASPLPLPDRQVAEMEEEFNLARLARVNSTPIGWGFGRWRHEFAPSYLNTEGYAVAPDDRRWMQEALSRYDVVWVYSLTVANSFGIYRWPRAVLDMDDVRHRVLRQRARIERNWASRLQCYRQSWLWRRREHDAFARFGVIAVTAEADRDAFGPQAPAFVVPNSFDTASVVPVRSALPNRLGFVGNLGFEPNRDGMSWFIRRVWPDVRRACPDAELRIAGSGADTLPLSAGQGLSALGWVADLGAEMATWTAAVVPIRYGGGSSIKVAEAVASGCPIVATTPGVRGFDFRHGVHASVADTARGLAELCVQHLRRPELSLQAQAARALFLERYAFPSMAAAVARVVEESLRRAKAPAVAPGN